MAKAASDFANKGFSNSSDLLSADNYHGYSPFVYDLYTKPYCRIGAYLVGMVTGFYLYQNKNKIKMSKVTVCAGWILAAVNNLLILYGLYPAVHRGENLSNNVAAFYNCMSRPMWCVGLAWVTIACVGGYGGYVNDILSWKGFIPLSRLTYCTYLVHPMVLMMVYSSQETFFNYNGWIMLYLFMGSVILCYILAANLTLFVEM